LILNTNTFNVYTQNDGLPGNVVSCILEDELGSLWMSTNNGVAKFNPQTDCRRIAGLDLSGWGNCFKSSSGEMFFGGYAGAVAFLPAKVVDTTYIPPIVLTDFRLNGNPVEIGADSPFTAP
jgi:Two component regulator propeller